MQKLREFALHCLRNWINLVQRFPVLVLFLSGLLGAAALLYTVNNLGMNTDTKDMLSPQLAWRQLDMEYEKSFPQYSDDILVVIEAPTADQALDAADLLYRRLRQETALFKTVFYPNELSIFRESALLFLDTDELQDLADNLAAIQPFLGRLTRDRSLRGLFAMLTDAIDAREDGEDIDLDPLLRQINAAIKATLAHQPYRVSWHSLMSGEKNTGAVHREFIILQPKLDYRSLLPATRHMQRIRQLSAELEIEDHIGARIRLTGDVALAHDDLLSVTRGTEIAMVMAFTLVSIIMMLGLGAFRLVIASLITLLFGLVLTAAFATLTVGELNLISVAFTVLYIGLGVDFAIHYCLRYRELRFEGQDNITAIMESSMNIGSSLFLCAATTAIGFFAFMPTAYDGVAELGWISGSGMFISLMVTLTVLPALLKLMPLAGSHARPEAGKPWQGFAGLFMLPFTQPRKIQLLTLIAVIVFAALLTRIRFDYNTLNLQDPSNESVQTYQDLLAQSDTSPWTGVILARGKQDAEAIISKLQQLPLVDKLVWLADFIPQNQDEKLAIIEEMSLMLGDFSAPPVNSQLDNGQRLQLLQRFSQKLQHSSLTPADPLLRELQQNLRKLVSASTDESSDDLSAQMARFNNSLLASLPGRLATLAASLNADYITAANLPPALKQRWYNRQGDQYLIEIYPREDIQDNDAMRRFVKQLQAAEPRVVGSPVINIEASDAVIQAFRQAFSYALAVITLLLLVLLTPKRDAVYIIASLLIAAVFTGGLSVLLNIPLNFANVIALPLLLGIGVDSGIHIMHRYRTAMPADNSLLTTSSARAVIVSAMTTIGGIGNLAFSPQLGTASMGKLLTIGVSMTLICMLVILPSLPGKPLPAEK